MQADNQQRFDTASMSWHCPKTQPYLNKYLKAPNMDIKASKGTLRLKVLYFAATLGRAGGIGNGVLPLRQHMSTRLVIR